MNIASEDLEVLHNVEARRFEIQVGNDTARLEYRLRDSTIVYTHTVVPPALEGYGIAGRLAKAALDYARNSGLSVVPQCPFVADYIGRHPQYTDLVAPRTS